MIYVIADDLTGATDTGVQLSKQGYETVVTIINLSEKFEMKKLEVNKADVIVLDTETRESSPEETVKRIKNLLSGLELTDKDIIYKKVDSTLRGNIGIELNEIINKFNKDVCLFTPAFPSNSRIVSGGYLLVKDEPLGISEYYNGKINPGDASFIPNLLKEQTDLSIGRIDLKEVIKGGKFILNSINLLHKEGKKIIIIDAVNNHHLKDILLSSRKFNGSILYSGSAGLANYLSEIYKEGSDRPNIPLIKQESFVIIGGSRNNILDSQIAYLKKKINIVEIKLNIKDIFENRENSINKYFNEAKKGIRGNYYFLIRPDPVYKKEKLIKKIKMESKLSFRELEVIIRDFLGELAAMIIKKYSINNLIITGGDTSIGVCKALGISDLKIQNEILPGIPLSFSSTNNYNLRLITKAGGFGEKDTLYKIINELVNYN